MNEVVCRNCGLVLSETYDCEQSKYDLPITNPVSFKNMPKYLKRALNNKAVMAIDYKERRFNSIFMLIVGEYETDITYNNIVNNLVLKAIKDDFFRDKDARNIACAIKMLVSRHLKRAINVKETLEAAYSGFNIIKSLIDRLSTISGIKYEYTSNIDNTILSNFTPDEMDRAKRLKDIYYKAVKIDNDATRKIRTIYAGKHIPKRENGVIAGIEYVIRKTSLEKLSKKHNIHVNAIRFTAKLLAYASHPKYLVDLNLLKPFNLTDDQHLEFLHLIKDIYNKKALIIDRNACAVCLYKMGIRDDLYKHLKVSTNYILQYENL